MAIGGSPRRISGLNNQVTTIELPEPLPPPAEPSVLSKIVGTPINFLGVLADTALSSMLVGLGQKNPEEMGDRLGDRWKGLWNDPTAGTYEGLASFVGSVATPMLAMDKPRAQVYSTLKEGLDKITGWDESTMEDWKQQVRDHEGMGDLVNDYFPWLGEIDLMPGAREWKPLDNIAGFVGDIYTDPLNLLFGLGTLGRMAAKPVTIAARMMERSAGMSKGLLREATEQAAKSLANKGTFTSGWDALEKWGKQSAAHSAAAREVASDWGLQVGLGMYVPGTGFMGRKLGVDSAQWVAKRRAMQIPKLFKEGFSDTQIVGAMQTLRKGGQVADPALRSVAYSASRVPVALRLPAAIQLPGMTAAMMKAPSAAYRRIAGPALREGVQKMFNPRAFLRPMLESPNVETVRAGLFIERALTEGTGKWHQYKAEGAVELDRLSKLAQKHRLLPEEVTLLVENPVLTKSGLVANGKIIPSAVNPIFTPHMRTLGADVLEDIRSQFVAFNRTLEGSLVGAFGGKGSPIAKMVAATITAEGDGYVFRRLSKEGRALLNKGTKLHDDVGSGVGQGDQLAGSFNRRKFVKGTRIQGAAKDGSVVDFKLADPKLGKSIRKQINDAFGFDVYDTNYFDLMGRYLDSVGDDLRVRLVLNQMRDAGFVVEIEDLAKVLKTSQKMVARRTAEIAKLDKRILNEARRRDEAAARAQVLTDQGEALGRKGDVAQQAGEKWQQQATRVAAETDSLRSELRSVFSELHDLLGKTKLQREFHRERVGVHVAPLVERVVGVVERLEQLRRVTDVLESVSSNVEKAAFREAAAQAARGAGSKGGLPRSAHKTFVAAIRADLDLMTGDILPSLMRLAKHLNLQDQTVKDLDYLVRKMRGGVAGSQAKTSSGRLKSFGKTLDELHAFNDEFGYEAWKAGEVDVPELEASIDEMSRWLASDDGRVVAGEAVDAADVVLERLDDVIAGAKGVKRGGADPALTSSKEAESVPIGFFDDIKESGFDRPAGSREGDITDVLAADIGRNGIVKPIVVEYLAETGEMVVANGNHRLAAARRLGRKDVPVVAIKSQTPGTFSPSEVGIPIVKRPAEVAVVPKQIQVDDLFNKADDLMAEVRERGSRLFVSEETTKARKQLALARKYRAQQQTALQRADKAAAEEASRHATVLELEAKHTIVEAQAMKSKVQMFQTKTKIRQRAKDAQETARANNRSLFVDDSVDLDAIDVDDLVSMFRDSTSSWGAWRIAGDAEFGKDIVEVLDAVRKMNHRESSNALLRTFDSMTNWSKSWLVGTLGFINRNGQGAVLQNWHAGVDLGWHVRVLEMGRHAAKAGDGDVIAGARKLAATGSKRSRRAQAVGMNPNTKHIPATDYAHFADLLEHGVRSQGLGATSVEYGHRAWGKRGVTEIGGKRVAKFQIPDMIWKGHRITWNPMDAHFVWNKAIRGMNGYMEDMVRLSAGMDSMARGQSVGEAIDRVYSIHFNYAEKTSTQRGIQRLVPFFTWTRYNLPFQIEMMAKNPGKFNRYLNTKRNLELGKSDDEDVPDYWLKPFGIRLPFSVSGGQVYSLPDLPFMDVMKYNPLQPVDFASATLGAVNPLIKAPIESYLQKQFFHRMPLTGRYQIAPTGWEALGIAPILNMLGLARKNEENDTYMVRDHYVHAVNNLLPFMERIRRWFPNEDRYQGDKHIQTLISNFVGLNVRVLTPEVQEWVRESAEYDRRDEQRDLKDIFEMRGAG